MSPDLVAKERRALDLLESFEGAVVAFSGGVDSTLLLRLAHEALGDRCVAVTAVSASLPRRELDEARRLAAAIGVRHRCIPSGELGVEGFAANAGNRCYFCKSELFDLCFRVAAEEGLEVVTYGATRDDLGDHRPGMRAARERGARAPLLEAELGKEEIRTLSRARDLPTADKPGMACLSSRFPYGARVTAEGLARVEAAEEALRAEGFRELRVRHHGEIARIELAGAEWERATEPARRVRIAAALRAAGFRYVTLDLEDFRSGRMNEALRPETPRDDGEV